VSDGLELGDPDLEVNSGSLSEASGRMSAATDELGGALSDSGTVQGAAGEALGGWGPTAQAGQMLDGIHQDCDSALSLARDTARRYADDLLTMGDTLTGADSRIAAGAQGIRPDVALPVPGGDAASSPVVGALSGSGGDGPPLSPVAGEGLAGAGGKPAEAARDLSGVPTQGDPVDMATGDVVLSQTDVRLPGTLALVMERAHRSSYRAGRWFGPSWMSTLDQRLEVTAAWVFFARPDGSVLTYPHPARAGEVAQPVSGACWPLTRDDHGYTVSDPGAGTVWRFEPRSGYYRSPDGRGELPLVSVTSRAGHQIGLRYRLDGAPESVSHSGGYRVNVAVTGGRVVSLTLAGAGAGGQDVVLTRYGYDEAGNLAEVINSSGAPLGFSYDQAGRLTGWQDRNGWWYRYTYDPAGRCVRGEGPDGRLSGTFSYDLDSLVSTHTDAAGAVAVYQLTAERRVAAVTDPLGSTTHSEYDSRGQLVSRTDPLGRMTRWAYDPAGNLTACIRPDGSQASARYNELNLPTLITEPGGSTWQQEFDTRGSLVRLTGPDGAVTSYSYDQRGNLAAVTDPGGGVTAVRSNPAGLPVAITAPDGAVTRYDRDAFGRVSAVTGPDGRVTAATWTTEGQLASRVFPDATAEQFSYDGEGNLVLHLNPAGGATRFSYTYLDKAAARTGPDGTRTELRYDHAMRLTCVVHGGLTWRYDYDPAGRLTAQTDCNGAVTRYAYDPAGQLTSQVNGAGQQTGYAYDLLGNITQRSADGVTTTFGYDQAGRLVHAANPDAVITLERDAAGRITAETCDGRSLRSAYDTAGQRVGRVTPAGAETRWAYDEAGRAVALSCAGQELRFGYDQAGRETLRQLPGGVTLTQEWDPAGLLAAQVLSAPAEAGRVMQRRSYSYRADGILAVVDDALRGPRRLALDLAGKITGVTGPDWAESYGYDPAGNITTAAWPAPPGRPDPETAAWAPGAQGPREYQGTLITRAGDIRYQHDRAGRIVLRQRSRLSRKPDTWRYQWDAGNHLTAVTTPDGTRWRYRYDPLGRRVAKQRLGPDGRVAEGTTFTWDGPVLAEQATTVPASSAPGQVVTWDYRPGTFTPLTQAERWASAPQDQVDQRFYAIVTDLVGSPAELVSPGGDLAGHQRQSLWGTTCWSGASTPLRFPGQYADDETGLHYNSYRYYDPATGRYISPDPLGLTPAPNPHAYVPNPTLLIDPLGLMACTVAGEQGGEPGVPTYHRLQSPTQPPEVAAQQVASGEVWGRPPRGSWIPAVQAYSGPLPEGTRGIEFTTDVPPDRYGIPGQPTWRGPREGVRVEGDFAKVKVLSIWTNQV
jgi:RHS repeat-associated protein